MMKNVSVNLWHISRVLEAIVHFFFFFEYYASGPICYRVLPVCTFLPFYLLISVFFVFYFAAHSQLCATVKGTA